MKAFKLCSPLLAALVAAGAAATGCGAVDPQAQSPDASFEPSSDDAGLEPDAAAPAGPDAGLSGPDAAVPAPDAAVELSARCASSFGTSLTNAFGRLDGTLLAVVGPTDTQCALPNDDHLVLQVQVAGEAYRMVVNVLSDGRNGTDTRMGYLEVQHALQGEPWSEGWHPGAALDYPGDLGAHSDAFAPHEMHELVALVESRLVLGEKVSVYATSRDRPSSAHLIHRNQYGAANDDGAIVVGPDSAQPLYLLFAFDGVDF